MKQALRATLLCAVVATGAAYATEQTNGVSLNGVSPNGVSPNGIALNGIALNKITVNGISLNRVSKANRDAGVSPVSGQAVRCDDAGRGACRIDVFRSLAGKAIGQ